MIDIFQNSFLERHVLNHGYDVISASFYVFLFIALMVIIYYFLRKRNIDLNYGFALATLPHIFLFAAVRVLEDQKLVPRTANFLDPNFYLISPGIWFFAVVFIIASFLISRTISKKYYKSKYENRIFAAFSIILIPALVIDIQNFNNFLGPFGLILLSIILAFLTFAVLSKFKLTKKIVKNSYNKLCIFVHSLDSLTPLVAKFMVGSQTLVLAENFTFFFGRIFLVLAFIYFVDKYVKKKETKHLLKFTCFVIGLAPALKELFLIGIQF